MNPESQSILSIRTALASGETTAETLTREALNRVQAHDNSINAFISLCADRALDLLAPQLTAKAVTLARTAWDTGAAVALDTHLMEQAIYGLLANAVEAAPAGSTLHLAAGTDAAVTWLTIRDAGYRFLATPES